MIEAARSIVESTLVPHSAFEVAMARLRQGLNYSGTSPEPICLALVGESRTGKSRVLEETELAMPRIRTSEGQIVPMLRLTTPSKPTVKGVAELLLQALGDPKWSTGTESQLTVRLEKMLAECQTLVIVLDEFQHFFDNVTQKTFNHEADWLKRLVDKTRVTLIVSGLETCLAVLLRNEQLAGRFLAPIFMRRFDWQLEVDRNQFVAILQSFNDSISSFFSLPSIHSDEMAFRFWCASGGLIGILAKLLRQVVWDAYDEGRTQISLEHLEAAHKKSICALAQAVVVVDSPFNRKFILEATQENIVNGYSVNIRQDEPEPSPKKRRGKTQAAPTLSRVLKASGD